MVAVLEVDDRSDWALRRRDGKAEEVQLMKGEGEMMIRLSVVEVLMLMNVGTILMHVSSIKQANRALIRIIICVEWKYGVPDQEVEKVDW